MKKEHTPIFVGIAVSTVAVVLSFVASHQYRRRRSQWQEEEVEKGGGESLPSIIEHFESLEIESGVTVKEANKRRTVNYYSKARDAHRFDLVMGVRPLSKLVSKRKEEVSKILRYANEGTKSHRTVIVMCDSKTSTLLSEARDHIFGPLNYSHKIDAPGAWIPELSLIPEVDMHVTIATIWWWHTVRQGNLKLSQDLASRLRQAVVLDFHHPFQIELERIILLGGKTLVALWRTIGERTTDDGAVIYDRHGEGADPFVRLRHEIVTCFTTEMPEIRREPLTYKHLQSAVQRELKLKPVPLKRQNTIETKTPGLGARDGFIHTTLCRLPLDCLSLKDVDLEQIHRLCREATATYCGHRMIVSKFRLLETTGAGGESNPCVKPIFDETIEAPPKVEVKLGGILCENEDLHVAKNVNRSLTIGALPVSESRGTMEGLFDNPDAEFKEESNVRVKSV